MPQGRRIFRTLTVRENLMVAAHAAAASGGPAGRSSACSSCSRGCRSATPSSPGSLSGGEQQMLAIGRALMGNPRVLLMDEPSEGLAPQIVAEVGRTIAQLKAEGQSIVLVEQNIKLTLDLADDVVIINTGRVVFAGTADQIKLDDAMIVRSISGCSDNAIMSEDQQQTMTAQWNKYEPTAARKHGKPGREIRPKSTTIDIHSHVGDPAGRRLRQAASRHGDRSRLRISPMPRPRR